MRSCKCARVSEAAAGARSCQPPVVRACRLRATVEVKSTTRRCTGLRAVRES